MAQEHELTASPLRAGAAVRGAQWIFSWPLLAGVYTYFFFLSRGNDLLLDGDTYWHIATGQLILRNGSVPRTDPFSHTMAGAPWTAHEWLAEVILAAAHQAGGWPMVVAVTALAFAATVALMTRALLTVARADLRVAVRRRGRSHDGRSLAGAAPYARDAAHDDLDDRVGAREREPTEPRACGCCPLMTLWANLHGGFTLGIALTGAMATGSR